MKTILLVDDSRAVRTVGRRFSESLGLSVIEADQGESALKAIHEHPEIDVILLDWNMPVMDGLTFLKSLRALSLDRQPVVVMCTTENELARIIEAMHEGANEYIMKPFTEDIVREKLTEVGVL